ncbi:leucyl/phenylalanyl-tRNA--protein transferase [Desulfonema magnum]|uniref:Leucyl/phenylalanyl-tRNA--protein transferase n=1 Tax=Desulfonema magnum TaxID=45655 RepID=A0A975BGI0_9BACT|nr:leucyl/phenylalanyl-tRNA--protein transferase [Desulfonema magnum]QTA84873.1 Leucyl/phenylalanyl-tRNA--protein transferase [Desulfonema magnum]
MSIFKQVMTELANGQRSPAFSDTLEPDQYGLVYVGGEISVYTVIEAYTKGCFPWTGSHPVPWFSPDPRLVLFPKNFRASRSLRKLARQKKFKVRFDADFRAVMENCAAIPRKGQKGTWITENMKETYCELHDMHIAHSVEVYQNEQLCGGLYGLTFGHAFFGESMFSRVPSTSKLALYVLCVVLAAKKFDFIDCQQITSHLMRLGAVPLSHREYMKRLNRTLAAESHHESWEGYLRSVSRAGSFEKSRGDGIFVA